MLEGRKCVICHQRTNTDSLLESDGKEIAKVQCEVRTAEKAYLVVKSQSNTVKRSAY